MSGIPTADDAFNEDNAALAAKLRESADARLKASAEAWSKGIAAILALIGAGAWIGGPAVFTAIDAPLRWVVLLFVVIGVAMQGSALAYLLAVSAGFPRRVDAANVRNELETQRTRDIERIDRGRLFGLLSIVPFVAAFLLTILAAPNTTKLLVVIDDGPVCGVVASADDQEIVLEVSGRSDPVTIPMESVLNLKSVPACG